MEILLIIIALSTAVANSTDVNQELVRATWALVDETRNLVFATIFSGIVLAAIAAYIGIRQYKLQKRLELKATMDKIRDLLSTPEMTTNRRDLIKEYCKLKKARKPIVFREAGIQQKADAVELAFTRTAGMVLRGSNDGSVDYAEFLDAYESLFLKFWTVCKDDISSRKPHSKKASANFEALINKMQQEGRQLLEVDCSEFDE